MPVNTGTDEEWQKAETRLGVAFPDDYKWFIRTYGGCDFFNFIGVLSPFGRRVPLFEYHLRLTSGFSKLQNVYPVYPSPNGILLVASDENGNCLLWRTGGDPNQWPLVYFSDDFLDRVEYSMGIVEFLHEFVVGQCAPSFIQHIPFRTKPLPIVTSCIA